MDSFSLFMWKGYEESFIPLEVELIIPGMLWFLCKRVGLQINDLNM